MADSEAYTPVQRVSALSEAQVSQRKAASAQAKLMREIKASPRAGKGGRPAKPVDLEKVRKLVSAGASVTQVAAALRLSRGSAQRSILHVRSQLPPVKSA